MTELTLTQTLNAAAVALAGKRYNSPTLAEADAPAEFWNAINDVLTELCFHIDRAQIIPEATLTQMQAAVPGIGNSRIASALPPSTETILTTLVQQHIDSLGEPSSQPEGPGRPSLDARITAATQAAATPSQQSRG